MFELSETVTRDFLKSCSVSDWEIATDTGWQPVSYIHTTVPYLKYIIQTETGKILECADDHIVFDHTMRQMFVKNVVAGQTLIMTCDGPETVVSSVNTFQYEKMFDLTVDSDDHRLYTSGILSHNSSVLIDALVFGIFGRAFRSINKNQLINSINKKHCEVIVEFDIDNVGYKVVRGIKPTKFEIYQNGNLINQDAASRDYQKVLEQQILKLNYKTFTQVVVLGASNYVPFMQLSSQQRREVIEDVLDIGIFSTMSQLLKERISISKERMSAVEKDLLVIKNRIASQKKLIDTLVSSKKNYIGTIHDKIKSNNEIIQNTTDKIKTVQSDVATLQRNIDLHEQIVQSINDHKTTRTKLDERLNNVKSKIIFFEVESTCPSCFQSIDLDHKQSTLDVLANQIQDYKQQLDVTNNHLNQLKQELFTSKQLLDQLRDKNIELATLNNSITILNNDNNNLMLEIENLQSDNTNVNEEKQLMKDLANQAIDLVNQKTFLMEEQQLHDVAVQLLKDTGVKTAIIKEYLPTINKLVNHYLNTMDLWVQFEFDESFTENVKSRGRDVFTYTSFSEGEKARINIALMLVWRQIAKMKNSVNTNLLILDEVADQNVDISGVSAIRSLFELMDNTNIFIISHKMEWEDFVNNVIRVKKVSDFTVLS